MGRPRLLWKTPPSGSTSSSETGKRPPTAPAARWSVGPVGGAKWILDGTLQRHDYLKLDVNGNVVFRGTSLRTFIPATQQWVVHWVMSNTPGYTYIDTEWRDGELHGTGYGFDSGGKFRERYRYWEITDSTYTFQLERTYDDGEGWQTYPLVKATKVADVARSMN